MCLNTMQKRIMLVGLITLMLFFSGVIMGDVNYPGNDDTFLNLISAGGFGSHMSPYMIHSNYLWGLMLHLLYSVLPWINVYFVVFAMLNVLCIGILSYMIGTGTGIRWTLPFVTVLLNYMFTYDFYNAIQYTKNAFLYFVTGMALFYSSYCRKNRLWIPASLLILVSVLVRLESAMLLAPFFVALFAYEFTTNREHDLRWLLKRLILPVGLICIALSVNRVAYQPEGWREYREYNAARTQIHDYLGMNYEGNREAYAANGITQNDGQLFASWLFADTEHFTIEKLTDIIEIETASRDTGLRISGEALRQALKGMASAVRVYRIPKIVLILLSLVVIAGNRKLRLFVALQLCLLIGIYYYFACVNRMLWRAELGGWIACAICVIMYALFHRETLRHFGISVKPAAARKCSAAGMLLVALLFLLPLAHNFLIVKEREIIADKGNILGLYQKLNTDDTQFYVSANFFVTNNPMEITRKNYGEIYKNTCLLGTWVMPSPTGLYYAKEHGITNPMKSLIDRDDVRLLCESEEMTGLIKEHLEHSYKVRLETREIALGIWEFTVTD